MKNLNINLGKELSNKNLLALKGGEEGCGEGFTRYECIWTPDPEVDPWVGPAVVCAGPGDNPVQLMFDMYESMFPNMSAACATHIVVE